jgi:hypothetical protein
MPEIIQVNRRWIKRQIDSARKSIGRNVTFYVPTRTACSLCSVSGWYDTTNDTTYYATCPICAGQYWITGYDAHVILARVHWVSDEAAQVTPGGKYYIGEATVTVENKYLDIVEAAQSEKGKVVVDNHEMNIVRITPYGAPEISRYRVVLKNAGERPA